MEMRAALLRATTVFSCILAGAGVGSDAGAQRPERVISLGQPGPWSWLAGAAAGIGPSANPAHVRLGAYRSIGNPVVDGLGLSFEGYAGPHRASGMDGGVRGRLMIPIAGFGIGADHNVRDARTDLVLTGLIVGRRGGLLGGGSMLRIDYVPARDAVAVGLELPVFRPLAAGRQRPRRDHVRFRGPSLRPLRGVARRRNQALDTAHVAAIRISKLTVPFLGRDTPPGPSRAVPSDDAAHRRLEDETRRFHDAVEAAFVEALADVGTDADRARAVAVRARTHVFEDVLLPYDRLLGQVKDPDTTRPLAARALRNFSAALDADRTLTGAARAAAVPVFVDLLEIIEDQRAVIADAWRDSRFAWLPLQLGLRPEEHDSQGELDALVARAVERPFTEGNFVSYVINEQLQYQLSRTIRAAEEYHIVWTHDFRGVDDLGNPDEMSYRHVVRSYLAALTERVRAYDRTGRLPTYMVLHDQWYYSVRQGPLFLRLLEDPTRYRLRLPRGFEAWEDTIAMAQAELRSAIAGSARLQAERAQFGDGWLRNLVKVHVSVMNRPDPSYRSWRLARGLPISDNILRDHRKLIFYDIAEDDPYRGEAIFTGAGVGEHYSNLSWEDRSLLVRGPALLDLKAEARNVLLVHGVPPERIPTALRPRPKPVDYDQRVRRTLEANALPQRALTIHNESGYDAKRVNVAKALLYTLSPAGAVVMVPDSFWNSEFWGGALLGAALRGARVLVIAPSYRSNSVEVRGTQLLSRELLWRMLVARERLAPTLVTSGGMLHIGIFDSELAVTDIPGKVRAVRRTFEGTPWLRELFGFPQAAYDDLARLDEEIGRLAMAPSSQREFEYEPQTRLHLKANFVASREAWRLMQRPEWGEMLWTFVTQRIAQVQSRTEAVTRFEEYPDASLDIGTGYVQDWESGLTSDVRERVVFYTIMGSQNQNYRSMVMDAEVAFVVANWPSVIPYLDAIALIGQSEWMDTPAELDALLPPMGRVITFFAHWGRLAF
jgi:phosphatidylserine/phosphatidylglycerophosphate/cardiolipin synthase-like enzyme